MLWAQAVPAVPDSSLESFLKIAERYGIGFALAVGLMVVLYFTNKANNATVEKLHGECSRERNDFLAKMEAKDVAFTAALAERIKEDTERRKDDAARMLRSAEMYQQTLEKVLQKVGE